MENIDIIDVWNSKLFKSSPWRKKYLERTDVIRKNKVNDNLVKMELDMDQGSMKAFAQFHDKKF